MAVLQNIEIDADWELINVKDTNAHTITVKDLPQSLFDFPFTDHPYSTQLEIRHSVHNNRASIWRTKFKRSGIPIKGVYYSLVIYETS